MNFVSVAVIFLSLLQIGLTQRDQRCPLGNDPAGVTLLPHEYDCTKYYACDWGRAILMPCPDGLHFNPRLMVCDWPWSAGCELSETTNNGGGSTVTVSTQSTPVADSSTVSQELESTDNSLDPRCPIINDPAGVTLLPHEYDCTKYYACDWGRAILMPCPDGLHFNPRLMVCDWPWSAGCELSETTNNGGGSTVTVSTQSTPVADSSTVSQELESTDNSLDPRCPIINDPAGVTLLPHEYDCTKYYACDWGRAILMPCPDGLHFNPRLMVCDWPWSAGCELSETTNNGGGSTVTVSTQSTPVADSSTVSQELESTDNSLDPRCPIINDPAGVTLLPHEYDCTKYYACDWGRAILMPCPDGLHFNPRLMVCDWPWSAGCELSETTNNGGGSTVTVSTQSTPVADSSTVSQELESTDNSLDPRCPTINDPAGVTLLPHEYDCTKYYACDWGRAILMPCPDGLHFNPRLMVCDWPWSAGCS